MFENDILLRFFELGYKLVGMKVGMMAQGIDLGLEGCTSGPLTWRSTHGEKGISELPLIFDSQQVATSSSAFELVTSQVAR